MTKVALDPRTWVAAYVHRPKHVYVVRVSEAWKRQVFCNNGWGLEWISHRL